MYTIETAKMSSKGQVVVPDALRKRYGWRPGTTLLMLGASGGVLLQSFKKIFENLRESTGPFAVGFCGDRPCAIAPMKPEGEANADGGGTALYSLKSRL